MKLPSLLFLCLSLFGANEAIWGSPFTTGVSQVDLSVAAGCNHLPVTVAVTPAGPGFDSSLLQVASDAPWVTPSVNAAGKLVLAFATSTLTNASSTATITATHGSDTATLYVTAAVSPLNIFKLLDDPGRSRTYGLQTPGIAPGAVLILDPVLGTRVGCVTVGRRPTGMAVSADGTELLVLNIMDESVSVVDLTTLELKETITLPQFDNWGTTETSANLAIGPGRILYYTDGSWAPVLRVYDRTTGTVLQTVFSDGATGNGIGDFALTSDFTRMVAWAQYGWSAGWGGSYLSRFTVAPTGLLTLAETTSANNPTPLSRDPLETPVLISADNSAVFAKLWRVTPDSLAPPQQTFPTDVYAISPGGEVACTSTAIYETATGNKLFTLPFTTTVQTVTSDYARLVLYNPGTREFSFEDLYAAIGPAVLGRTVQPADGSIVLPPPGLQWSPLPGIDSYQVYLGNTREAVTAATTAAPEYRGTSALADFSLTGIPLANSTTYYWRADAMGPTGPVPGPVFSFTVSPISSSSPKLDAVTVQGHSNFKHAISLDSRTGGTPWQASASESWVSFETSTGVTPSTLTILLNAAPLAPGIHPATVTLSNGTGTLFTLPVKLKVEALAITQLKSDPVSNKVYAISEVNPGISSAAYLLELDAGTETINRVVPAGSSVTDLAIHPLENRIYVPNWLPGQLKAFNLTTLVQERSHAFSAFGGTGQGNNDVYRVAAGAAGRLVVEEEDQWVDVNIFNTTTGVKLGGIGLREGGGAFDPTGRYYYHGENNSSGAKLYKLDVTGDIFTQLAAVRVESFSYYGSRTVVVSGTGNAVFWNGSHFDANLVEQWKMSQEVYATTADGRLALGETQIFDTSTKQVILGMPASTRVSTIHPATGKIVVQQDGAVVFYSISHPAVLPAPVLSPGLAMPQSITLQWLDRSLELGYTLQKRFQGASLWEDVTPAPLQNAVAATVTGLAPGKAYEFRLKADAGSSSSAWSNALAISTTTAPPSPPYLYQPQATSSTVTLNWTTAEAVDRYVVERSATGVGDWSSLSPINLVLPEFKDLNVLPQTTYYYRLKAVIGIVESAYSQVQAVTTPMPSPPATPAPLRVRVISGSQLQLDWDDVGGETGYLLERRTDEAGSWSLRAELTADTVRYSDNTVSAGVQYWYRLSASNGIGTSPATPEVTATPAAVTRLLEDGFDNGWKPQVWGAVSGGTALDGGPGFPGSPVLWFGLAGVREAVSLAVPVQQPAVLEFTFRAGHEAADGHAYWNNSEQDEPVLLEYQAEGGAWSYLFALNTLFPANSSWSRFSLAIPAEASSPGTRFRWRQMSHSGPGTDTWALENVVLTAATPARPPAPAFLLASPASDTAVSIYWAPAPGATSYVLERTAGGNAWVQVSEIPNSRTWFSATGLMPHSWYRYRLRAVNAGGVSEASYPVFGQTYSQMEAWRLTEFGSPGPSGPAASEAHTDGLPNLLRFAFNLSSESPRHLVSGTGTQGLPEVTLDPVTRRLQVEFIRRKATMSPGITYEVQFGSSTDAFQAAGSSQQVTSLDDRFERVVWQDGVTVDQSRSRFGRVRVMENP
jgi:hypothetical protein